MLKKLNCYADGGKDSRAYGSFAVFDENGEGIITKFIDYGSDFTNNEAEYRTLIELLNYIMTLDDRDEYFWEIYSDSQLMINQIYGKWKIDAKHLKPFREMSSYLISKINNIRLNWTPRKNIVKVLGH